MALEITFCDAAEYLLRNGGANSRLSGSRMLYILDHLSLETTWNQ